MTANLLTLNPFKTEFMLIGLPQQLSKIRSPSLSLPPAQPIRSCSSARNLGFVFDSSLSLFQPTNLQALYSSYHYHIRDLRRIRNSLDHKTAATIATFLVHSRLDYCNSFYYSLPASQLHRLQLIQNALARAVSRTPLHSQISAVLHLLHWLKIEQRIKYKIISITHNLLHSATPSNLYRLLNIQPTRPTRSANCMSAHPKLTSLLKLSVRPFRNAVPSLWNKLSTTIRSLSTETTHACQLSTIPTTCLISSTILKHLKTFFHSHLSSLGSFYPSAVYLFDQSLSIPCNCIECPRIYQLQLVLWAL